MNVDHPRINDLLVRIERLTGRYPVLRGDSWQAHCPAHDDRRPSLSIRIGDAGHVLVKCHAGCTAEAVTRALGLSVSALMPEQRFDQRMPNNQRSRRVTGAGRPGPGTTRHQTNACPDGTQCVTASRVYKTHAHAWAAVTKRRNQPEQSWEYHDRSGELAGLVLRWNIAGGGKDIRPLAHVEGGWIIGPCRRHDHCIA